jgi:hypothetical protein
MTFIPPTTYVPPPQATLEAQELARELECLIEEFQDRHPRIDAKDVQQAIRIVGMRAGAGQLRQRAAVVVLAVGLGLLAFVLFGLMYFRSAG